MTFPLHQQSIEQRTELELESPRHENQKVSGSVMREHNLKSRVGKVKTVFFPFSVIHLTLPTVKKINEVVEEELHSLIPGSL